MRRAWIVIPLVVFVGLVALLAVGLTRDPSELPSPLIGKPAPAFQAESLFEPTRQLSAETLKGQVSVVNVWASWCVACREEHPVLARLARLQLAPLYGLNYKDERGAGLKWLAQFGNVYDDVAYDPTGRIGLDWGVYGVPETFVLDRHGVIRHKHIGPIDQRSLEQKIIPWIQALKQEGG